jgi:hypothetical protein
MNTLKHSTLPPNSDSAPGPAEETLRLIAQLPAPEGLAERVQAGLRTASLTASNPARARILHWPTALQLDHAWMRSAWMRGAAAAAIVFVVAGGGWGIYSRVAPVQQTRGIALPHVAAPGGFAGAGAMRTPQTLNGPLVAHPATAEQPEKLVATPQKPHRGKSTRAKKAAAQPVAPLAK